MAQRDETPRDLLFGLLALQIGLIDQDQLVAAFSAWSRAKGKALAEILFERGAIDAESRSLLTAMAEKQLKLHGGDTEKSLAAVTAGPSTRARLATLGDTELTASIAFVGSQTPTQDASATMSVGTATSDGQRFRVLRPHAQGGLGAVFVALDGELNREVALKQILDQHADDSSSRTRFLIEAEITGGLEHPGIVPVYGLGHYGDGRPYYAMRFIRGDSLKEAIASFHADESLKHDAGKRSLALRKLLRRFVDVCNAIDYAHGRGVLHRDLKPGNVIVGKHGETLVVDWGLAKPMGRVEAALQTDDERTLLPSSSSGSADTLPGSVVGTPAYMSPEQARGDLENLGPRSDVYSLGATLYCLLTGKAPFEKGTLGEVLRAVQKGEFPLPRQIDPTIDKALEAVCTKAMALNPEDRHATARALADDIDRWSADEPTSAWSEPFMVRARRWMRRNRTTVAAASVALLAGLFGTAAVLAVQTRANADLMKVNGALKIANGETVAALAQSEESRKKAEAVGAFLVDAFKKPDPDVDGKDVKVADILDQAMAGLDKGFSGSKATEGALLDALGQSYMELGFSSKSEEAHRKARAVREAELGPDHPDTLESRRKLASAFQVGGRFPEAIALYESTLKVSESKLGPDHLETIKCRKELADAYQVAGRTPEAIARYESTLKQLEAKLGNDHKDVLSNRLRLAVAYQDAGRTADAIAILEPTLKQSEATLGPDHQDVVRQRTVLARAYQADGRAPEALGLLESALKLSESKLGPDHPTTLAIRSDLAGAYFDVGKIAEAIPLYQAALKGFEAKFGADHPSTLVCRNNLADAYQYVGRNAEAIPLFESAIKGLGLKLAADHPNILVGRSNLARAYRAVGRFAESTSLLESTLKAYESKLGPDRPVTVVTRLNLAQTYEALNRWADAEALHRANLASSKRQQKPEPTLIPGALLAFGQNLLEQSKWVEAEPPLRESLAIRIKDIPDMWQRFRAESALGEALLGQKKFAEAEPLIVGGYEGVKAREAQVTPPEKPKFTAALNRAGERVVRLYKEWGKPEKAAEWAAKIGPPAR